MLRYLAVLAVMLACFTGDVSAVTDQEFQELAKVVEMQALKMSELESENIRQASEIRELRDENKMLGSEIKKQASHMSGLKDENKMFVAIVRQLQHESQTDLAQNTSIEERVTTLEVQMTIVQDDIAEINTGVTLLFEDVNFLFDEQVIQDERLFSLEEENDQTVVELDGIEDEIDNLQDTTLALDFRVTELEENGGSDGNSSISELEVRVETLEGTVADHEARITSTEGDVEDLEGSVADHETRLNAAEENIQGLQMTDINHDARITALEENGGGGGSQNDTIAFHAVLTSYSTIPEGTAVEFNEIVLNEGNGYDSTTGVFTVPPGGDGVYYFSTYLMLQQEGFGDFDMELNDDVICSARGDQSNNGAADEIQPGCSAVVSVVEGDELKVVLRLAIVDTPLYATTASYYNGFSGFRI